MSYLFFFGYKTVLKRYLILNADDFGYSAEVNQAVLRAHCEGVLTSASLMVAEPGFTDAVTIARHTPMLGVGLHLAVTADHALLPRQEIPLLVDANGRFGADPFRVANRYYFLKRVQVQLRREMEAQFARFAQTGLAWSHVDGHQHFHMQPVVWDNLLDLCEQYGVHRVRLPYEEIRAHVRVRSNVGPNLDTLAIVAFRALRRRNLRVLQARQADWERKGGRPFFICDRVYGHLQTGNMNTAYTLALLERLHARVNEIYFHPGSRHAVALPAEQQREGVRDVELQTLLAPALRARIEALGLQTGTYAEIEASLDKSAT